MMRNKQDPVEFLLEENPNLDWDDIHDVRELAELLGAMVTDLEEQVEKARADKFETDHKAEKISEHDEWTKVLESGDKRAIAQFKLEHNYCMSPEEMNLLNCPNKCDGCKHLYCANDTYTGKIRCVCFEKKKAVYISHYDTDVVITPELFSKE